MYQLDRCKSKRRYPKRPADTVFNRKITTEVIDNGKEKSKSF
jgi:hypothetical protein